ncbi:outer membrane protein assembly factor BamA [Methylocystis sp. SC2]|uniref:outer membrane protein assembly factor BamA n=1 Tax=Methylocystis sp. (strain SC2) TaxID=187303 RepID=UPI00027AEA3B|nr:outer membrane protein assembly factor BamA [Methylocystis sp. SC2]CCJ08593.1 Outer membrane protein assembly complex, YaeT protein [Methylocystis sp. SC2]
MRSISGIWKSSFLFAVVAALLAFSVPAFAAPDINRVAFEGNSKVKTDMLQEQVRSRAHTPFNPQLAEADVARLTEVYRRSGRAAAKLSYRTVELPNGRVDLVFTIVEGDKTGVKEIRFIGNEVYSTRRLVGMMETTEMNFLSFLKTSDVYDPDRIAADLELIRRFYLKNGYADFRVISSDAQFDPTLAGYIITIVVNEGPQYRVSSVGVESHLPDVDGAALNDLLRLAPGDVYNGDAVEKTVEALTREIAKRGYAFTQARPRGERNPADQTVAIQFLLEEGPRVYIERINIRGNTRTRDYVIRREFDIGEGDAYNRVLIDRAERRLNGLGYFKKVKITNEPGSAPDRVILNVDVEDQPTGNFGISGGYSTNQGFIAEVSVSESNFMGRGQAVRLSVQGGQIARGVTFSFTEPYFLDQRIAAGFDVFVRRQDAYNYSIYSSTSYGGTVRFGIPITEELSFSPHYSIYQTTISIPNDKNRPYNDCLVPVWGYTPGFSPFYPQSAGYPNLLVNCQTNGEASLAIKESQGGLLTSLVGYSLNYSTIDNFKNPHNGWLASLNQDVAGLGGGTRYLRTTGDIRYFREIPYLDDVVGIARLQGGDLSTFGGYKPRIQDNFNLGPSLVRGFAPGGIGPRDSNILTSFNNNRGNSLGGSNYVGGSLEVQFPFWYLPKDLGLRGALFADAGSLWNFSGKTNFANNLPTIPGVTCIGAYTEQAGFGQGNCVVPIANKFAIRSSVGASVLWNSPMGPIRFDYAVVTSKVYGDITQNFRFSGGTNF